MGTVSLYLTKICVELYSVRLIIKRKYSTQKSTFEYIFQTAILMRFDLIM